MNDFSETNVPKLVDSLGSTKIVDIASGCHHILLLTENGEVLSFGEGSKGQLGRIPKEKLQSVNSERQLFLTPQKVEFDDSTVVIEKIWSAHWSSFAQSTNGDIYVWGLNNFHQLDFKTENPIDKIELRIYLRIIIKDKRNKLFIRYINKSVQIFVIFTEFSRQ
jgi:alpha-tubulin suppressor-like RCC1 family protein